MFGAQHVLDVVRANQARSAQDISEALCDAVRRHVSRNAMTDDLTATVIKVAPSSIHRDRDPARAR